MNQMFTLKNPVIVLDDVNTEIAEIFSEDSNSCLMELWWHSGIIRRIAIRQCLKIKKQRGISCQLVHLCINLMRQNNLYLSIYSLAWIRLDETRLHRECRKKIEVEKIMSGLIIHQVVKIPLRAGRHDRNAQRTRRNRVMTIEQNRMCE